MEEPIAVPESSRTNADDRLPLESLGRVECGDGIIVSPGATYKDALRDPRPVGILLVCCLVIAMATGLPQFNGHGMEGLVAL